MYEPCRRVLFPLGAYMSPLYYSLSLLKCRNAAMLVVLNFYRFYYIFKVQYNCGPHKLVHKFFILLSKLNSEELSS